MKRLFYIVFKYKCRFYNYEKSNLIIIYQNSQDKKKQRYKCAIVSKQYSPFSIQSNSCIFPQGIVMNNNICSDVLICIKINIQNDIIIF